MKNNLNYLGKLLGVIALIYVLYKLNQEYTLDSFLIKFNIIYNDLPLLILINYISLLLGILAWYIMLLNYSKKSFSYLHSYYYFAKTEIAKYLPGNIFHFVGRQILANDVGISQKDMIKISLIFSLMLAISTIISSTLFFIISLDSINNIIVLIFILVIVLIVLFYIFPSFNIKKKIYLISNLAVSVALQGIIIGFIFKMQISDMHFIILYQIIGIYILSWLIGFVTPGASGGLGVREGAFISISEYLNVAIPTDIIIFSVVAIRLINISVDIIAYLSTYILGQKLNK